MHNQPHALFVLAVALAPFTLSCAGSDAARPPRGASASSAVRTTAAEDATGITASVAHGKELFEHSWTRRDPKSRAGDGLGPSFNGSSCTGCHNQGAVGGAGGAHGNTFILNGVMIPHHTDDNGRGRFAAFEKGEKERLVLVDNMGVEVDGGLQGNHVVGELLDLVRPAVQGCFADFKLAKADKKQGFKRVEVRFKVDKAGLAAGTAVAKELKPLAIECVEKALKDARLPASSSSSTVTWGLMVSETTGPLGTSGQRNPTALFGAGVIDKIEDKEILRGQAPIAGHPEITGVVGRTSDGKVARFGWKSDVEDLDTFVARACALEVGLDVPGMHQHGFDDDNAMGNDLNADDVKDLTRFVGSLPPPGRAAASPESKRGARLFDKVGCMTCHQANLGAAEGVYSDLLLHDMGSALADGGGYGGGMVAANDREWRTPPLWGARDSGPWMHDGRARSLREAILSHSGEAAAVRSAYETLRDDDQHAVVAFLESLQAPASL